MTQDMQKGPVSRAEQHEIGGTSEFGNKKLYPEGYSNKFHRFLLWLKLHPPRSGEAFCALYTGRSSDSDVQTHLSVFPEQTSQ